MSLELQRASKAVLSVGSIGYETDRNFQIKMVKLWAAIVFDTF